MAASDIGRAKLHGRSVRGPAAGAGALSARVTIQPCRAVPDRGRRLVSATISRIIWSGCRVRRWTTSRLPDLAARLLRHAARLRCPRAARLAAVSSGWPEASPEAQHASAQGAGGRASGAARARAGARANAPTVQGTARIESNFTRGAYEAAVQQVVDYILAGDIFQANLSQRFLADLPAGLDAVGPLPPPARPQSGAVRRLSANSARSRSPRPRPSGS